MPWSPNDPLRASNRGAGVAAPVLTSAIRVDCTPPSIGSFVGFDGEAAGVRCFAAEGVSARWSRFPDDESAIASMMEEAESLLEYDRRWKEADYDTKMNYLQGDVIPALEEKCDGACPGGPPEKLMMEIANGICNERIGSQYCKRHSMCGGTFLLKVFCFMTNG